MLGQADHCGLGGAVGEAVGHALDARGDRGHVDDRAVPALQHAGQYRADGADHRLDVEVEGEVEVAVLHLENRAPMHDTGAVEEDVDLADLHHGSVHGGLVEDVELHGREVGELRQFAERLLVDVGGMNRRSGGGKGERRGAADALAGGGDENGLSFKHLGHVVPWVGSGLKSSRPLNWLGVEDQS